MKQILNVCAALLMLTAVLPSATTATPNDTARFLAGLPVEGNSPLQKLQEEKAWKDHAAFFNEAFRNIERRQLSPIRAWTPGGDGKTPMYYMFSGPDFLYASTFFPKAPVYILAGLEPIGPLPDVAQLGDKLPDALANLRKSQEALLNWSFFRTKDMKVDFRQTQLNGTLPVLYVFLARQGCRIQSVDYVTLDKAGAVTPGSAGSMGVKIVFSHSGDTQTLYYFSTNLADGEIKPAFLTFCAQQGDGVSLIKAASYLMHSGNFSTIRKFLLEHSKLIVQDDSGIPLKYFENKTWNLRFEGVYTAPTPLFKEYYQSDLSAIYKAHSTKMTFGFGYQWRPGASNLMVAERKK